MDHEFSISQNSKTVTGSALVFLWVSLSLTSFIFLATLLSLLTGQALLSRALIALAVSGYGFYIGIAIPLQIINHYNSVRITDDGLFVRVFAFRYKWKFVEWKNVKGIKLLPALDRRGESQWLIEVNGLTYWHQLISRRYGANTVSGIVINSDMNDRERLLNLVEKRIKKK